MANTLAANIGDAERAAEIVGRELVGFIPSMQLNAGSQAVALNGSVNSLTTEAPTVNTSVTPSMTIPQGDDQTIGKKTKALSQVANVTMNMTGEEARDIAVNHNFDTVNGNRYLRAFRAIRNQIESKCGIALKNAASRAYGTAGTTPFASDHKAVNHVRQILVDNGMFTEGEVSLVTNSLAGTNFRNLSNLFKVNEAGTADLLRQGVLQDISGIMIRESAGVAAHTAGTGDSLQTSAAEALGSTVINVDTGTGTVLAGDIVTFTGDSVNKYVVNTALDSGSFVIGDPGIQTAVADNVAMAVGAAYTGNVMFNRNATELAIRPLASPEAIVGGNGDAASEVFSVQDPISGITYEIRIYGGFHKALMSITLVFEPMVWEPSGVALLLG